MNGTEVLQRKRFNFYRSQIAYLLAAITRFGIFVEPSATSEVLPDMKDLHFYEVVAEKRKTDDACLATGNRKHFPITPFVVTAKEMFDIFRVTQLL